jgi:hypothetical protein
VKRSRRLAGALAAGLLYGYLSSFWLGCAEETDEASGGAGVKTCSIPSGCAAEELCDFPDDLCGAGEPGICVTRSEGCLEGTPACGCDGQVYESSACAAVGGSDLSAGGGCSAPSGTFACGPLFCFTPGSYCERTAVGGESCVGAEAFGCAFFDPNCAPQDCSCLPGLACEVDASGNSYVTKTAPGCPP